MPPAAGAEGGQAEAPQPAEPAKAAAKIAPRPPQPGQVLTLGSADPDPKNPYRMLATFSNRGAALVRIELSSPRYHDLDDRGGYLGHLVIDEEANGRQLVRCRSSAPALRRPRPA